MSHIVLVRHAPTHETGDRLTGRAPGVSLGVAGRKAARAAADALSDLAPVAVYSSPIERTMETAAILAQPHQLAPIVEPGLNELDFGAWTGETLESLRRSDMWEEVQKAPSRFRFPDGESFVEAQQRAVESLDRIARELDGGTALAVSHCDIIKLVISHYLGQPLDFFQRLRISTASISELRFYKDGSAAVVSVNATGVDT